MTSSFCFTLTRKKKKKWGLIIFSFATQSSSSIRNELPHCKSLFQKMSLTGDVQRREICSKLKIIFFNFFFASLSVFRIWLYEQNKHDKKLSINVRNCQLSFVKLLSFGFFLFESIVQSCTELDLTAFTVTSLNLALQSLNHFIQK